MTKFSYLNAIFREPWMIEPQTAAWNKQLLVGYLQGLEFEPEENITNYAIGHKDIQSIPAGRKVNVVNLIGTMMRDDGDCGLVGTRTLAQQLTDADGDDRIIGHILLVDSGGGASNSVDDLAEAITKCSKPVVAYVDGMMCSAAMFAASYCDNIIAHNDMDRVGCIGTLVELAGWPKQVKESDGYIHLRIYADGSEEKNGEYEAALEGDFKLIKENTLNPLNERFKAEIRKNRQQVTEDQLKGRTYFARDVVGSLVDSIGDFPSAVNQVIQLSNVTITNMEGFNKIQSIESCRDLQEVDGTVTLNREQLADIDAAIPDTDASSVQEELAQAQSTIKTLQAEKSALVSQHEAKVAELQATISELQAKPAEPSQPAHNGNHISEADNSEPETYCMNLKKELHG